MAHGMRARSLSLVFIHSSLCRSCSCGSRASASFASKSRPRPHGSCPFIVTGEGGRREGTWWGTGNPSLVTRIIMSRNHQVSQQVEGDCAAGACLGPLNRIWLFSAEPARPLPRGQRDRPAVPHLPHAGHARRDELARHLLHARLQAVLPALGGAAHRPDRPRVPRRQRQGPHAGDLCTS